MTITEALQWLEQYERGVGGFLVGLPILTFVLGTLLKWVSRRLAGCFLALVVHLAVIPGISMAVLVLYMLFFLRANLLHELHLILHVLPIISMGVTLWATSRILAFDDIPGFKRIEGLMLLVGLSFAAILAIEKTRIGVFFLARFEHLVLIIVGLVVLWKFGLSLLFGSSKTSKRHSPGPASARNPHNRQPR